MAYKRNTRLKSKNYTKVGRTKVKNYKKQFQIIYYVDPYGSAYLTVYPLGSRYGWDTDLKDVRRFENMIKRNSYRKPNDASLYRFAQSVKRKYNKGWNTIYNR